MTSPTYVVRSSYLKPVIVNHFLQSKGWKKGHAGSPKIDWLYEDGKFMYGRNTLKKRVKVKSMLNEQKDNIAQKDNLYTNLMEKFPENPYIKKQFILKPNQDPTEFAHVFQQAPVWIVKPVHGFKGQGIHIIRNTEQLQQLKQKIDPTETYVIQEYIINPLLWDNKYKFHLRVMFIITSSPSIAIYESYVAILAKDPYNDEDFSNKDVHDTHATDGLNVIDCKDELVQQYGNDNFLKMNKQIHDALGLLPQLFDPKPYNESTEGFEVFGADIMFDDNFQLYFIEVNRKLAFSKTTETNKKFIEFIYNATNHLV